MIYITKCSICLSFIHRYSQMFSVVLPCHLAVVPPVSNFNPNPMNHVHICGRNCFWYPYHTTVLILWGDFFVILGPEFSLNGSRWLRMMKPQTTLCMLHTSIWLPGDWQNFYAALHKWCHWGVWMKTWGLGTTFKMYLTKLLLLVQKLWQQIFI